MGTKVMWATAFTEGSNYINKPFDPCLREPSPTSITLPKVFIADSARKTNA